MKKLMIAMGAVAFAASVHAAVVFNWYENGSIAKPNTVSPSSQYGTAETSGRVYLIDQAKYSQQTLFTALAATPNWTMATVTSLASANAYNSATLSASTKFGTVDTGTLSNGKASWEPDAKEYPGGNDYNFYQVLVDGENFYISDSIKVSALGTGTSAIKFANSESKSATGNVPTAATATFTAGGWYTAAPEPTSGLLLLLGMAGLALKRKRA